MSSWTEVPCLLTLRDEFNLLSPHRDKGADGTIGDLEHQQEVSDHNPDANGWVKALDIDSTGPWPEGHTFHEIIMFIVGRCRSGAEKRIRYIIHNGVIYHESDKFAGREYDGKDPHTNHAHFSSTRTVSIFKQTQAWGLVDQFGDDMPTAAEIAKAVWEYPLNINVSGKGAANNQPAGGIVRYSPSERKAILTTAQSAVSAIASLAASEVKDDAAKAAALKALSDALTGLAPAIVAAVVAAMPPGVQVSADQLKTAFVDGLREVLEPSTPAA